MINKISAASCRTPEKHLEDKQSALHFTLKQTIAKQVFRVILSILLNNADCL